MNYYCNPLKMEYRFLHVDQRRPGKAEKHSVYREAADPSLVWFRDRYYLFPSMTAGFLTSHDLIQWELHPFIGSMPIYDYAPDVRVMGDYLYFSASKMREMCSFYRTKDPLHEPFEELKGTFAFWDPNLFVDEDGRVYFYWGCSNVTPIYGVELEPETMKPKTEPLIMFNSHKESIGYERIGDDHICPRTPEEIAAQAEEMVRQIMQSPDEARRGSGFQIEADVRRMAYSIMGDNPYIEGAWMTKYRDTYYLQYAAPGTQYNVYADGVYTAKSPLGPFTLAKNNPFSYKPGGFINGAGHGSTLLDQDGRYWHTATMSISRNHDMERRIGLWKAGFDEDGELYCDQRYGDWPIRKDAPAFADPEWMLLSYRKAVRASSGMGESFVTDENVRTWWRAASNRPGEWVEVDLGTSQDVRAIQINFAEDRIEAALPEGSKVHDSSYETRYIDTNVLPTRWILEGSENGTDYVIIADRSEVKTDYSHDFLVWEDGLKVRYLRLTIRQLPYNQVPCVSGIRVFGLGHGQAPKAASNVRVSAVGATDTENLEKDISGKNISEMNILEMLISEMLISWEPVADTVGYNVLWGYAADKLYHSYMVFGKNSQKISALIGNEPVYVRVDAFNESGIMKGEVQRFR